MSTPAVGNGTIALALLMQMSIPPKCFTPFFTASMTLSSERISQTIGKHLPPIDSISFAAVNIVPGSFG